jgi:hypothetical protein
MQLTRTSHLLFDIRQRPSVSFSGEPNFQFNTPETPSITKRQIDISRSTYLQNGSEKETDH